MHSHHYSPSTHARALGWGMALNAGFVIVEIACGMAFDSLALLADAGHNAGDVMGLALAWGAALLARRRPPCARYTYGLQSSSILAALANAVLLLGVTGAIVWEALLRFNEPPAVAGGAVIAVALAGAAVNGATALLLSKDSCQDLNIRGAYLHMAADAAVSLGVAMAGVLILLTGYAWIDPLTSIAVSALIVIGMWGMLKDALRLALHAVPARIELDEVRAYLNGSEGVREVHDLHVWAMSTTETALSAHLLMPDGHPGDAFVARLAHDLGERFGIGHATLQIELGDTQGVCALASDEANPAPHVKRE